MRSGHRGLETAVPAAPTTGAAPPPITRRLISGAWRRADAVVRSLEHICATEARTAQALGKTVRWHWWEWDGIGSATRPSLGRFRG